MHTGPLTNALPAKIIVFTDRHTILAEMQTGSRRLSDVVNDPLRHQFVLDNARINRSDRMDECVGSYGQITVRRDAIQGLLIMTEPPRPAQQRLANYVAKTPVRIAVLLPAFLIEGDIYLPGKLDATVQVLEGTEGFAVLSQATVTITYRAGGPINVATAMVHRGHMEMATVVG